MLVLLRHTQFMLHSPESGPVVGEYLAVNLDYVDEIGRRKMFRLIHEWCNLHPVTIHVNLTIDIIKHVFKTNINSEFGVPPSPQWYEIKFLTPSGVCQNTA